MRKITELNKQWNALRYAVDQIDLAWSYEASEYSGEELDEKREEMTTRRAVLIQMQDKLVETMHAYQEIKS